ncbi:pyridoxamine 5'-phosphate oxidase family protein [Laceyella putida]|uniref:Pyridoxamine 5'-phosphate oxidase family protein n=1 Tax=Laceyella putida TaxID=110101 RepID=A0ABW2RJG6_9BACL
MNKQELSPELYQLLNGKNLDAKQHEAMMLLTVTEDLWPHTAMISVGEIIATSPTQLRLALWPATTTTANIIRTGKATLVAFIAGKAHYVRLSLQRLAALSHAKHKRERFAASVVSVREDVAKYAGITSGVRIELKDSISVIKRWEETIEELLR